MSVMTGSRHAAGNTDRRVLDSQLQATIDSFEHQTGLVKLIDDKKTAKDLRDAINSDIRIIMSTLQKFPVIFEEVDKSRRKNFAVIIDEAHSSQTGDSAMKMKIALADTADALQEYAEFEGKHEEELGDSEDVILKEMVHHGNHKNLSFFAFTATPRQERSPPSVCRRRMVPSSRSMCIPCGRPSRKDSSSMC